MIYGDPPVGYGTGEEFAVNPGEEMTVQTKVKDGSSDIKYGEVWVYWEKIDSDPYNSPEGAGSLSANSTKTADGSGVADVTFTCSSTRGDDHIVKAKNKETGATSENDSGKAVVWKVEFFKTGTTESITEVHVGSDNNENTNYDGETSIFDVKITPGTKTLYFSASNT